jgi:hypothetical protein
MKKLLVSTLLFSSPAFGNGLVTSIGHRGLHSEGHSFAGSLKVDVGYWSRNLDLGIATGNMFEENGTIEASLFARIRPSDRSNFYLAPSISHKTTGASLGSQSGLIYWEFGFRESQKQPLAVIFGFGFRFYATNENTLNSSFLQVANYVR